MTLESPDLPLRLGATDTDARVREAPVRFSLSTWLAENRDLIAPGALLAIMLAACFVVPLVYPLPDPAYGKLSEANLPPLSAGHVLGTDRLGGDLLSRALYGGRVSILIGCLAVLLGMAVGAVIGTVAGYQSGPAEVVLMRGLDMFLAFPSLVLAMVIVTYLGPSELHLALAISFFTMPGFGRLARAATLKLRDRSFIVAARLAGTPDWRIMLTHIGPSIFPPLLTYALLMIGVAIMIETSLSFLGLGVPEPHPSWGNMIGTGQTVLTTYPYMVIVPIVFLFLTVLAFNKLGDALRAQWSIR